MKPDDFSDAHGSVLVIGFGRFGQIVSQCLLAEDIDVTTIDNDPEMIQDAAAVRLQSLLRRRHPARRVARRGCRRGKAGRRHASTTAQAASRIVDLVHAEFPGTKLYVRSYDRRHTLQLIAKGVDFELRETYESALVFGRSTLEALGPRFRARRGDSNSSCAHAISIGSPSSRPKACRPAPTS